MITPDDKRSKIRGLGDRALITFEQLYAGILGQKSDSPWDRDIAFSERTASPSTPAAAPATDLRCGGRGASERRTVGWPTEDAVTAAVLRSDLGRLDRGRIAASRAMGLGAVSARNGARAFHAPEAREARSTLTDDLDICDSIPQLASRTHRFAVSKVGA